MFLNKTDLDTTIYPEIANAISRYSDVILTGKLAVAESELETYLCQRYLIRPELEKTGAARNAMLLSIALDLAVYHLYANPESVPVNRVKRYEQAIRMLEYLAEGRTKLPGVAPAPLEASPAPTNSGITFKSQAPRPTGW